MIKIKNVLIVLLLLAISKNILLGIFTNNDKLIIHGKISPYYTYTIKTYYEAQSSLPICYGLGSGMLWGGSMFSKKHTRLFYEPTINGDTHTISIPLGYPGLNICDYQLSRVALDVPGDNDHILFQKYVDISYVGGYAKLYDNPNNRTSRVIPVLRSENNNSYTIDFYSSSDYARYLDKQINLENLKNIKQKKYNASLRRTSKEQSLLAELVISPYIGKYKKFPTENEIQNLLSKANKLIYVEKKHRAKYIQKLQKNITYVDGYPVDEWGNHFQYKIIKATGTSNFDHVVLFSFGPDGVKSEDDIRPNIRQGLPDPLYNKKHQFKKKAMHTLEHINLLTSLLTKYQYKYKKVANNQEAKELFKKHSKYNIQPTDSWGKKLNKSDLNYINDEPVDEWGHPFAYDIDSDKNHPIIYSLGEDGVKSGDDIKRKMYKLF